MKLLPDAAQCHAQRLADGGRYVLEQAEADLFLLVGMVPMLAIPNRFFRYVRLILLGASIMVAFVWPPTLFVLTSYWIWASWRNGECHHCDALEEENHDASEQRH